jgi:ubiquinone/menaquinone biosynthesis C-methylase UbiE
MHEIRSHTDVTLMLKDTLAQARARNEKRLNRSLTPVQGLIAQWNILVARCIHDRRLPALEPEAVEHANREYSRRFPPGLAEKVEEVMIRPDDYIRKMAAYERSIGGRPTVTFPTDGEWYRLIVSDPLRIEEELLLQETVLEHGLSEHPPLRVLDVGTGNGRMAQSVFSLLSGSGLLIDLQVYGLDSGMANLVDGQRMAREQGACSVHFMCGDMAHLPLGAGSCSIISAASCFNLVPEYEQPLVILEMLRCLRESGEVLITGPNERFSAERYVRCTVATNLAGYLLPWNMARAHEMGQVGLVIDELVRKRFDCSYLQTGQLCEMFETMGCTLLSRTHWPGLGSEAGIFSGLRFRVTAETKRLLRRYTRRFSHEAPPSWLPSMDDGSCTARPRVHHQTLLEKE